MEKIPNHTLLTWLYPSAHRFFKQNHGFFSSLTQKMCELKKKWLKPLSIWLTFSRDYDALHLPNLLIICLHVWQSRKNVHNLPSSGMSPIKTKTLQVCVFNYIQSSPPYSVKPRLGPITVPVFPWLVHTEHFLQLPRPILFIATFATYRHR